MQQTLWYLTFAASIASLAREMSTSRTRTVADGSASLRAACTIHGKMVKAYQPNVVCGPCTLQNQLVTMHGPGSLPA